MIKLKHKLFFLISLISFGSITSCSKQVADPYNVTPAVNKKFQFTLYTDKDFSTDNDSISFTLFIQDLQNRILWDSALRPMTVKDIPGVANKLVMEKNISVNNDSILKVGFKYAIRNVGYSSFYDTCSTAEIFKEINFNFQ